MSIKKERITKLVRGQNVFKSTGLSEIKVTRNGEIVCLEIPIRSTGVSELIDAFRGKAPKPPIINKLIEPDSELGKELKITKKNAIKIFDYTNEAYLKEKEQHDSQLGLAIALQGLDFEITNEDGSVITEQDEKIKVMKEMGMSGEQFSQLVSDITNLTKWSIEERTNFLG
jgi:hypothetical protein